MTQLNKLMIKDLIKIVLNAKLTGYDQKDQAYWVERLNLMLEWNHIDDLTLLRTERQVNNLILKQRAA